MGGLLIVFLLLLGVADGKAPYASAALPDEPKAASASYFQQEESPYEETKDYLFDNAFADLPHHAISLDFQHNSKFKSLMRWLTYITENQKQISRRDSSPRDITDALACNAVDYYIYALRRILL